MHITAMKRVSISLLCITSFLLFALMTSCSAQSKNDSIDPGPSTINTANLFSNGENMPISCYQRDTNSIPGNPNVEISYPTITTYDELPYGLSSKDFFGGQGIDNSNIEFMEDQYGFTISENGKVSEGYCYLDVTIELTNTTQNTVEYDMGRAKLALLDEQTNTYSNPSASDGLWCSNSMEGSLKKYWIETLLPYEETRVSILYAISKDMLESKNLVYLVDPGYYDGASNSAAKAFYL